MRRREARSTGLLVLVAAVAVAVPILLATRMARSLGLETERSRVRAYVHEVLRRSELTTEQADDAFTSLASLTRTGVAPCSDRTLELMRSFDLSSDYIQAIGAASGAVMTCDSVGGRSEAVDLGPVDVTSPGGVAIRYDVQLPFAPGQFIAIERDGFVVIVHRDLVIDTTTQPGVSLGVFTAPGGIFLTSRGRLESGWLKAVLDRYPQRATRPERIEATFVKNGQLVSVMTSPRRFVGAISSLPTSAVDRRARAIGYLLVPIGAASGLALALAALYLGRQRLGLPNILRGALRRDEFFLVYQPIVDLDSGRWCGAEALIRWRRPDGELVQPDLFVPIAERCLSTRFTEHVIDLVARDLATIAEHPHFYLSVNVTAADLERPGTVELFRKLIVETNAPPDVITIEATERSPLNQEATGSVIRDLHQLGIRVVIDDFGTGYSTLSYLRTLDVAALKIDKSFVETLGTDAATNAVAFHIIEMAKELDLDMIAEGVENEAQAQALRERGVRRAQGWLFSHPLSLDELIVELDAPSCGRGELVSPS